MLFKVFWIQTDYTFTEVFSVNKNFANQGAGAILCYILRAQCAFKSSVGYICITKIGIRIFKYLG